MAVYRETPKCQYCGKPIAKAKYKDESYMPNFFRTIGDTFIGWIYKDCNCKRAKKARRESKKKQIIDIGQLLNKIIKK